MWTASYGKVTYVGDMAGGGEPSRPLTCTVTFAVEVVKELKGNTSHFRSTRLLVADNCTKKRAPTPSPRLKSRVSAFTISVSKLDLLRWQLNPSRSSSSGQSQNAD